MPTINQHFVPRVYIRQWTPNAAKTDGVYCFPKNDARTVEWRNCESILSMNNTYTVDYDHSIIVKDCYKVLKDFSKKTHELLVERNVVAKYNKKELWNIRSIAGSFQKLDEWEFYNINQGTLASKKANVNSIKQLKSYVIDDAFNTIMENCWVKQLNAFIGPADALLTQNGEIEYSASQAATQNIIELFVYMAIRNPAFDLFGVFSFIRHLLNDTLTGDPDIFIRALWLREVYRALFSVPNGSFHLIVSEIIHRCGILLMKIIDDKEGQFITSDNPAFFHHSTLTANNYNGLYFPLTPRHLIFIGLNTENTIENILIRSIRKHDITEINRIILSNSTKQIISNQSSLSGYI